MNILRILSVVAGIAIASTTANAATIIFDDLGTGNISNGYAGFDWDNFDTFDPVASGFANTGYANGVVSPSHIAYNAGGSPASFSSAAKFTLVALDITAAWNAGLNVLIQGLIGGVVVNSSSIVIDYKAPTHVAFNWGDIDEVLFTSSGGTNAGLKSGYGGTHFALDNVTVSPSAVPLPAGAPLLLAALAAIALATRLRRA